MTHVLIPIEDWSGISGYHGIDLADFPDIKQVDLSPIAVEIAAIEAWNRTSATEPPQYFLVGYDKAIRDLLSK